MLRKVSDLSGLARIHNIDDEGFVKRNFIEDKDPILVEALDFYSSAEDRHVIDGLVGAAYERYEGIYVCRNKFDLTFLRRYESEVSGTFPIRELGLNVCASVVGLNPMDGLSSHKDFSYNKFVLGTLVLDGEILYGTGSTRENAYHPENLTLLEKGDLALLKSAPFPGKNFERPYFYINSPRKSVISRIWIRDATVCHSKSGGKNES